MTNHIGELATTHLPTTSSRLNCEVETHHVALLAEYGFEHFDLSESTTKLRGFTQRLARELYDAGSSGVYFQSNLDVANCDIKWKGRFPSTAVCRHRIGRCHACELVHSRLSAGTRSAVITWRITGSSGGRNCDNFATSVGEASICVLQRRTMRGRCQTIRKTKQLGCPCMSFSERSC